MKPQQIEPNTPLNVTMKAAEWENVIAILRRAPYEQVASAIQTIVAQCMTEVERGNSSPDA